MALLALLMVVTEAAPAGVGVDTSPDAQAPTLGAHTLLVQADGQGSSPAVSPPITTQAGGSSLLALVAGHADNADGPTDSHGNHWTQVGHTVVYRGYEGRFDAKAYVALSAMGGPGHTVSVVKPGHPAGEISVPFVEIRGAGILQDVAQNYPAPSFSSRVGNKLARTWHKLSGAPEHTDAVLTSDSVTTTGPATLVAVWWGDGLVYRMTAVPDNGFKVIDSFLQLPPESGVQCAVAVKQVAAAGTYDVSWSGSPAQGAILWLFAFQHGTR